MTQDSAFRQAYDKWHDSFSVDSEVDTPWHRAVQSYLPAIGKLDGKRILEIGCGRGAFACWLSRAYSSARVTTADFSGAAIAQASSFAQKSSINNIEWKIENIQVTSLPGNSFDVVISCETVEHLLQPASAVKELARCSSPAVRYFLSLIHISEPRDS